MKQRWAMFAMGVWLAGNVMVAVVAAENFYTVDRLLAGSTNRVFTSEVARVGHPQARDLLRYLSSELNRRYFQLWNATEVALGVLVLWLIARGPSAATIRWGVLGMVGLVVLAIVWLTPEIGSVGRSLDFVARDPAPPALRRVFVLHRGPTLLSGGKLLVGVILSFFIARGGPRHRAGRGVSS